MPRHDALLELLVEFFQLPSGTAPEALSQKSVANWDSLAMVRLIAELQSTFFVEFDLDEIETLTTYTQIREALTRKGVTL
jgi:acyl carrier protein